MVTPGRFELPTCGLGNRRSIHLSYGATFRINNLQPSAYCWDSLSFILCKMGMFRREPSINEASESEALKARYQNGSIPQG